MSRDAVMIVLSRDQRLRSKAGETILPVQLSLRKPESDEWGGGETAH